MGIFMHHSFEEVLSDLRDEYERVCRSRDRYQKQVEEWNKDEDIQQAKDFAESCLRSSLLQMSEQEIIDEKVFRDKHYHSCGNDGRWLYEISHTGIGHILKIKCPTCGEEKDITDMGAW